MNLRSFLARTRYRLRTRISHIPAVYLPLANLRRRDADGSTLVTRSTDLVVEAFPRSGNTFAVTALRHSQARRLDIAHHFHASSQLIKAVRLHRPALLIIREPRDAVLSFVLRRPGVGVDLGLASWLEFHRALQPCLGGLVIATFEQVTRDFDVVIDAINRRFGTSFEHFEHTAEHVDECFRAIEERNKMLRGQNVVDEMAVARPSGERSAAKAVLDSQWQNPQLRAPREAAAELYDRFLKLAIGGVEHEGRVMASK